MLKFNSNSNSNSNLAKIQAQVTSGGRHVAIDVDSIVFAGNCNTAIVHQRRVKHLSVLHLGLESVEQLTFRREGGQVKVVVVVGDDNLSELVDADADRVVGEPDGTCS